ncbi:LytR C-terminal domain-containing protein [Paractinoplanes toevensis]|uniref:LytR/CpsA/Psr regulator C-terminal domain-containing protein n=1 Tax=Paractinoplanes toevensis TaxID=571911 RepID=A0A919VYR4_9ACTN|nr:LytR C-terminal domain-containing protein [Actinoplanes toevensis]GIM89312.1 hypothetical protein Ato02nite_011050 [Actinoplanes toevensis]
MSRPVEDQLRELSDDVQNLHVLPAAAVRARGRRRGRQQMAALAVAGAVIATTAGITVTRSLESPTANQSADRSSPLAACVVALPDSPDAVRIRVLDGGAPAGLPGTTAAELRARSFTVVATGTSNDPAVGAATLSYGPTAIGAANLLRAVVQGQVTMRFDPERHDDTVDLALGPAFTRLTTTTELNQNLAAAGEPTAPPQCPTVVSR